VVGLGSAVWDGSTAVEGRATFQAESDEPKQLSGSANLMRAPGEIAQAVELFD
jgi:hypothetical protein